MQHCDGHGLNSEQWAGAGRARGAGRGRTRGCCWGPCVPGWAAWTGRWRAQWERCAATRRHVCSASSPPCRGGRTPWRGAGSCGGPGSTPPWRRDAASGSLGARSPGTAAARIKIGTVIMKSVLSSQLCDRTVSYSGSGRVTWRCSASERLPNPPSSPTICSLGTSRWWAAAVAGRSS